jgi:branched-chain amino acid transport system permease protein
VRTRGKIKLDYSRELAVLKTKTHWFILAVFLMFLFAVPYILAATGNNAWLTFTNFTFITIIAVLGLNVITGMAGQVSLGHSAFIMVGGYTLGILTMKMGWSFWLALPAGAVITAAIGLVVGAPSVRLRGFYLAIATFAFLFIAQFIIKHLDITNGIHGLIGIPSPAIGDFKFDTDLKWYYLILLLTIGGAISSVNLTRSRLGRAFFAVRDNDITAPSIGINVYLTKVTAFFIGSLYAGVAGGLSAGYLGIVRADQFTVWESVWYLGMVIIGGAGSTAGTVLGVLFLRLVSQVLHIAGTSNWLPGLGAGMLTTITYAVYGATIITFVSFQPYGLISIWRKWQAKYKRWPFG